MQTESQSSHIPVIDISPSNSDAPRQLLDAAMQVGFIFVANDESIISSKSINDMFKLSKEFFALPPEVKEEVSINSNKAGKNHGWLSQGVEKLDPATQKRPDVKEAFNLGLFDHHTGALEQPLPALLQQQRAQLHAFQRACDALCQRVLALLAAALALDDADWFRARHDVARAGAVSSSILRLLYYPQAGSGGAATAADADHAGLVDHADDLRAGAHSDYGSLTCLFQLRGQPGLEIRTPGGAWAAVPVDPVGGRGGEGDGVESLPVLLNIGDLLEDWTGGMLRSTVHRVVFPRTGESEGKQPTGEANGDRYSIAYFCHPLDDALLEPVPSEVVREYVAAHPRKTRTEGSVITARDHLMKRLAATYSV